MFERAKWTAYPRFEAPLVIKKFCIEKQDKKSMLAICGLGWYYAFLNGKQVGNGFYQPAQTDYEPRDLHSMLYPVDGSFKHRVYYNVFDVSDLLVEGENELRILLGNGWYRQKERSCEGNTCYGDALKLIFELKLANGETVFSDGTLCYRESYIKKNNLYTGETQDFAEPSQITYRAVEVPPPDAAFEEQPCPPDVVLETIVCRNCGRDANGKLIFDAGRNVSGRALLRACAPCESVTARYSEELYPDGTPDFSTTCLGSMQIQTDVFYGVKKGQVLAPVFSPHAFRYIEIDGEVDEVTVQAIATDLPPVAEFSCSEEAINWLFEVALHTVRSSFHGGIPVDCPHRERLGYTADGQLAQEFALLALDSASLYEKWLSDIADGQSERGEVRNTAPFEGGGGGPVGWGGAIVTVPYTLYRVTGELAQVRKYFPAMRKWCSFVADICKNGLVEPPRAGVWFLGEWCTPEQVRLPAQFVNTCLYVRYLGFFRELCEAFNEPFEFEGAVKSCRAALKSKYRKKEGYFGGDQGAELFAWAAGLSTKKSRKKTVRKYSSILDTGIFGTQLLFDFLAEEGRGDVIVTQFLRKKYPSYGYWFSRGATTFWESWSGADAVSHNHAMFASPVKHLFYTVGCLSLDPAGKCVEIRPEYVGVEEVAYRLRPFGKQLFVKLRFRHGMPVLVEIEAEGRVFVQLNGEKIPVDKKFIWKEEV